jgi:hypothetical protein
VIPLVEISVMRQKNRTLMHFINISGHSQTAYFGAIPMTDIKGPGNEKATGMKAPQFPPPCSELFGNGDLRHRNPGHAGYGISR